MDKPRPLATAPTADFAENVGVPPTGNVHMRAQGLEGSPGETKTQIVARVRQTVVDAIRNANVLGAAVPATTAPHTVGATGRAPWVHRRGG